MEETAAVLTGYFPLLIWVRFSVLHGNVLTYRSLTVDNVIERSE